MKGEAVPAAVLLEGEAHTVRRDVVGAKHDAGKDRWDLLPFAALKNVVRVLTHGADKYGVDNWQLVPDWRRRYTAAALRHLTAWYQGERTDQESGAPHLAHAVCCLLFLLTLDAEG